MTTIDWTVTSDALPQSHFPIIFAKNDKNVYTLVSGWYDDDRQIFSDGELDYKLNTVYCWVPASALTATIPKQKKKKRK